MASNSFVQPAVADDNDYDGVAIPVNQLVPGAPRLHRYIRSGGGNGDAEAGGTHLVRNLFPDEEGATLTRSNAINADGTQSDAMDDKLYADPTPLVEDINRFILNTDEHNCFDDHDFFKYAVNKAHARNNRVLAYWAGHLLTGLVTMDDVNARIAAEATATA